MAKRTRNAYTETQREKILAAAQAEGLTAEAVQKRFGVKPVTYYSWRKKFGLKAPRGRRSSKPPGVSGDLGAQVRASVQAQVRAIMPVIVREEVGAYLTSLFGRSPKDKRQA